MKPGDIVICTDARLSEGRLIEGWRYVVRHFVLSGDVDPLDGILTENDGYDGIRLVGVLCPDEDGEDHLWKSSRFRLLERKEIEDKVDSVIADNTQSELAKEE